VILSLVLILDLVSEVSKFNPCHESSGAKGGQFCSTGGSGGKVGGHFQAGSKMSKIYGVLEDGETKSKAALSQLGYDTAAINGGIKHLHKVGATSGKWTVEETSTTIQLKKTSKGPEQAQAPAQKTTVPDKQPTKFEAAVAREKLIQHSKSWAEQLSFNEREDIHRYTGSAYRWLNAGLRGERKLDQDDESAIQNLTTALKKSTMTEAVVVYRGVSGAHAAALVPGKVFVEHGFLSTSTDFQFAEGFGESVLRIKVKVGTNAAFVAALSTHPKEREVLVNRGATLKVIGKSKHKGDWGEVEVIDLENF
jgi:hypothetical protein